jgi:1-aminocyclopropane-1-carboxylate deaminase/D-cysteine desulfhydrase-like pyridoxal-dependent ACC family enzyme
MTPKEKQILLKLTPVQRIGYLYLKRDDLFRPFGVNCPVNGGKLRQALWLMTSQPDIKGVVSGSSIHSPQSPIISVVANYMKIPNVIYYGGITPESLDKPMPRICRRYGAQIEISKSGRHNVIYSDARKYAKDHGYYCVEYGMNSRDKENLQAFYEANANQAQNIPDKLDNLVVTCGSGITATGIIYGLRKYGKKVKNIILVGVAPNRIEKIRERLELLGENKKQKFTYIDRFSEPGFSYEKREPETFGEIELHPNYEAKTFAWIKYHIDVRNETTLMWIVGSEPTAV